MSDTLARRTLTEKFASSPWWRREYDALFTEDVTMDFPFAPPGMPQRLCTGMVTAHRLWWSDTVPLWRAAVTGVYAPRDAGGDSYFFVSDVEGEVCWAGTEGHYTNHLCGEVTFRGDRICRYREWSSPLEYLNAIGAQYPKMRVKAGNERLSAYYSDELPAVPPAEYDLSPAACARRREDNILNFMATDAADSHEKHPAPEGWSHTAWFLPPDMKYEYTGREPLYLGAWRANARDEWLPMPDPVLHETEDENIVFVEMGGISRNIRWAANPGPARYYSQRYIMHLEMDERGFLTKYHEYLNPVWQLNSLNRSVPTFPYLF